MILLESSRMQRSVLHCSMAAGVPQELRTVNSNLKKLITGKDKMDHSKKIFFKKAVVISC